VLNGLQQSKKLAKIAEEAAASVGEPLRRAFRSAIAVDYKVDLHDHVTIHDKQTEEALRTFIFDRVPDSTMLGEEGGRVGTGAVHWFVDPIDGTSNFAAGIAFWCVSIAAVIDGRIVAGVVFDPVANLMFSADLEASYLNGVGIQSSSVEHESHATLITGYPVARDFRLDGKEVALRHFGELAETFSTLRRPGSAALSICHVAAGWADAAVGFGVNAWDVTAAILILRNAGGSYRPLTLGKALPTDAEYNCPGYVATGANADYPTLDRVADAVSDARDAKKTIGKIA